ncbi:hypothetical protein ID866_1464 [Astraeus odoratus]|nr:hypothetical protein ID866_1464 [Astraeus odoratus]
MLWPLLALFCVPLCFAAQKSPREELVELAAAGNGIIRLNDRTFDLLTSPKRDWSASIQLTALNPQRREFDPSFHAVAKAWATAPPQHRDYHFFASVDFDDAHQVFQKLGIMSAPVVHVFPATEGPNVKNTRNTPSKYDFSNGFEARPLADQLSVHTPIPIPYKDPINWSRITTFLSLIPIVTLAFRFIRPALQNRWVWATVTVFLSTVMTSGYMFTRIRGMPYTGNDGSWIAGGYSNQYGQEVQVLSFVYVILAGSFLMLVLVVPRQLSPARQRTQIYVWTAVNFIVFSALVSIFRVKNRGYPFKLMF